MNAIAQEAGAWLYRLKDDRSDECRAEFSAWLQRSPQHVSQFLLMTATDVELGVVDVERRLDIDGLVAGAAQNVLPLTPAPLPQGERGRKVPPRVRIVAWAAAAVIACVVTGLILSRLPTYSTDVGEQRTVKLDDGSVVQLNTRSRIEVHYSREARVVRLSEGEALFTVAHDAMRPFTVESGTTTVQAVGTQFNVYRHSNGATVSVVEGRVKVLSAAQLLLLNAGEEASVSPGGRAVQSSTPQVARALAWRQRRLEFRSETVAEVAAEFNRYNRLQIRIADPTMAQRRMTGLFQADEPQSLIDFLARDGNARFESEGDVTTVHRVPDLGSAKQDSGIQ